MWIAELLYYELLRVSEVHGLKSVDGEQLKGLVIVVVIGTEPCFHLRDNWSVRMTRTQTRS